MLYFLNFLSQYLLSTLSILCLLFNWSFSLFLSLFSYLSLCYFLCFCSVSYSFLSLLSFSFLPVLLFFSFLSLFVYLLYLSILLFCNIYSLRLCLWCLCLSVCFSVRLYVCLSACLSDSLSLTLCMIPTDLKTWVPKLSFASSNYFLLSSYILRQRLL
jgi:hypothetical protein